jgi:hypothetical protein
MSDPVRDTRPMTDADVLAAIRANHIKANIAHYEAGQERAVIHWDRAWLDGVGGSIYAKVPITSPEWGDDDEIVVRVRPPARLLSRIAARWTDMKAHLMRHRWYWMQWGWRGLDDEAEAWKDDVYHGA